jgi:hypothetical protein
MPSHHPRSRLRVWTLGLLTLALVVVPQAAMAQVSINPTVVPAKSTGGWVYWMDWGAGVLGILVLLLVAAGYLRFAPRFYRSDREEEAKRTAVPAPSPTSVRIQYTPPPQPEPAAVGAGGGGGGTAAPLASPSPTPLRDSPAAATGSAAVQPATSPAAAPAAGAPASAPRPAAPKHEGPVELDQETFDRVLQEQLDKGTDRRVAEGRARSAAVKAAREKAGG